MNTYNEKYDKELFTNRMAEPDEKQGLLLYQYSWFNDRDHGLCYDIPIYCQSV